MRHFEGLAVSAYMFHESKTRIGKEGYEVKFPTTHGHYAQGHAIGTRDIAGNGGCQSTRNSRCDKDA